VDGNFLSSSENQIGYDFGGGVTRKIRPNIEIYAEFRFVHGRHSGITTDFHPITLGVRW
jgi:opacity protein-like surface antigen